MKSYTHTTKRGFGGFLKAGIPCFIRIDNVKGDKEQCMIELISSEHSIDGQMFQGKRSDLEPIEFISLQNH